MLLYIPARISTPNIDKVCQRNMFIFFLMSLTKAIIAFTMFFSSVVNSWKLSRTRNLTAEANFNITQAINRVEVLDERYFNYEGQAEADCFFYPDNEQGDVILEGQCVPDNQVDALSTFNANLVSISRSLGHKTVLMELFNLADRYTYFALYNL